MLIELSCSMSRAMSDKTVWDAEAVLEMKTQGGPHPRRVV